MKSPRIRLRYSTVLNYVAVLYRLLTAVLFAVIVIRKLSVESFGLWVVAFSMSNVFALPSSLWNYWMFRFASRGFSRAPFTGLVLTLLYAATAVPIFVAISWGISRSLGGFAYLALFGSAMVISNLVSGWARTLANSFAPEVNGYAGFVFNTVRIALAYALVVKMGMGLVGAFVSFLAAQWLATTTVVATLLLRGIVVEKSFDPTLARSWLKRFYVPVLGIIDGQIVNVDRPLASLITKSLETSAIMGVVYTVRTPLAAGGASALPGLSARMLRAPRGEDVEESIRLTTFFTFFTLATALSLAVPIISLYNPRYLDAYAAFVVFSVATVLSNFASLFIATAVSSERADLELGRDLLSTRLFRIPLAKLVIDASALGLATGISWIEWVETRSPALIAVIYALCWLGSSLATCAVGYLHAAKSVRFRVPWREMLCAAMAAVATTLVYYAMGVTNMVIERFWRDAPRLALAILAGFSTYVAVEYLSSPWFRRLVSAALRAVLSG